MFKRGTDVWPEGETLLHVYAVPDLAVDHDLAALVHGCREAADGYPLTFVADRYLHLTVAQFPDRPAREYSPPERTELAAALQAALHRVEPFQVQVGSCLTYHSGLIADVHPDDQLAELHDVVADAARRVRGTAAVAYDTGVPHLTLAYATGEADSDALQSRLRRVRPGHATMTVRAVQLLDVASDADAKTITWGTPLAELRLGGSTA